MPAGLYSLISMNVSNLNFDLDILHALELVVSLFDPILGDFCQPRRSRAGENLCAIERQIARYHSCISWRARATPYRPPSICGHHRYEYVLILGLVVVASSCRSQVSRMVGLIGVATVVCIAISHVLGGWGLERKYGTAWHKPGCAISKFDYWVKNASTDATRRRGGSVGGSSRLGEDQ
jgi:hypothetical protein